MVRARLWRLGSHAPEWVDVEIHQLIMGGYTYLPPAPDAIDVFFFQMGAEPNTRVTLYYQHRQVLCGDVYIIKKEDM